MTTDIQIGHEKLLYDIDRKAATNTCFIIGSKRISMNLLMVKKYYHPIKNI